MLEEMRNGSIERAMHEMCMSAKNLGLRSIDLRSAVLGGKLFVRINGILMCEESCESIDIYKFADWVGIIADLDVKWQQTNSKLEKQRFVDGMVSEFRKLVLQSA